MQTRPTGVTILAVLAIVAGVFAVFAGLAMMALGAFAGAAGLATDGGLMGVLGALGAIAGVLLLAYAGFCFAVSYGLFKRMRWAWYASLVLVVLQLLQGLMSLLGGEIVSALIGIAIGGFVAWYLLSPAVQSWFGVAHKVPWQYKATV